MSQTIYLPETPDYDKIRAYITHPIPWNQEKKVGWGIAWGWIEGYPGGFHYGADFYGPVGVPILAGRSGLVVAAEMSGDYGNRIDIYHQEYDMFTVYAHLNEILVYTGMKVETGQQIGTCGNTGNTVKSKTDPNYGSHLHLEVRYDFNERGSYEETFTEDPVPHIYPAPMMFAEAKQPWKPVVR